MKVLQAITVLALSVAAFGSELSLRTSVEESLEKGYKKKCTTKYRCPSGSRPKSWCPKTYDDCICYGNSKMYEGKCVSYANLRIINMSFQQPFSRFFVMVHSEDATPLYEMGQPASEELAILAEDGNPTPLVEYYKKAPGVLYAEAFGEGPLFGGEYVTIPVKYTKGYDRVTIATMQINTNDCFTAVNGVRIQDISTLNLPGLDAGSETNNELCTSIPGPACDPKSGNVRSGKGEGFVHIHRGFHGINEGQKLAELDNGANGQPLSAVGYDWRNPLMRVIKE